MATVAQKTPDGLIFFTCSTKTPFLYFYRMFALSTIKKIFQASRLSAVDSSSNFILRTDIWRQNKKKTKIGLNCIYTNATMSMTPPQRHRLQLVYTKETMLQSWLWCWLYHGNNSTTTTTKTITTTTTTTTLRTLFCDLIGMQQDSASMYPTLEGSGAELWLWAKNQITLTPWIWGQI